MKDSTAYLISLSFLCAWAIQTNSFTLYLIGIIIGGMAIKEFVEDFLK